MIYYKFSGTNKMKKLRLDMFGGVDFFSDASQVSLRRSPDALNMIADSRYFPVKRTGYKKAYGKFSGRINGMFLYSHADKREFIVHTYTELHSIDLDTGEDKMLYTGINNDYSSGFVMKGIFYFLDGKRFMMYDGKDTVPVDTVPYIPTTVIGRKPSGGGERFESENLLTQQRKNSFTADGTSKEYKLDSTNIGSQKVECVISGVKKTEGTDFTVNRTKGSVTFNTAPANDYGADSVQITFYSSSQTAKDDINKCTICSVFGAGNATTVFLSGNKNKPNADWHSGTYNPTYFPKSGYSLIGSDSSAIMGYLRQFDTQIIIKSPGSQDATQYLRTCEYDEDTGVGYFPVQQGADGIGACAKKSFAVLEDTPLFLSDMGVYASVGNDITLVRTMSHRSKAVDKKLLKEANLEKACGCEYMGRYYLAVNSHCYVADSRQLYTDADGNKSYEWYYWDNIPAICFIEIDSKLYFGTEDGYIYRFCNDSERDAYSDNGAAIKAYWKTPMLDMDVSSQYKNIRRVTVLTLPYARSSVCMLYNSDREWEKEVLRENVDMFSWEKLDFSRFSFRTIPAPIPLCSNRKLKKTSVFQVVVKNEEADEPFGFLSLEIDYMTGGRIKK